MTAWKILNSRYLLKRWWMNIREDHVLLPDGTELPEFHVLEYPDWASTICLTPSGDLVLVEQYRHGIGQKSLELPAGAIDSGENPLTAAQRELLEETGYTASEWIRIGVCAPEPSKHTNHAYFFVALNAVQTADPELDAGEHLHVVVLPSVELFSRIEDGSFKHGVQIAAVFWAQQKGFIHL